MSFALILSTFLIGVSPATSGDSMLSPMLSPPTEGGLPLPPLQNDSSSAKTQNKKTGRTEAQSRDNQRSQARSARYSGSPSRQQSGQGLPPMMPMAPTDSSAGGQAGQSYDYLPPTAGSSGAGADGGGRPSGNFGPMNVPTSPTRGRPDIPQSYKSMQTAEQQNRRMDAARNSAAATPQSGAKAFAGYTQQSSGVSPYMNLFRNGTSNGTIDNYTTLVKPQIDQRFANQQFGSDIRGLENSTRVQGLNIRQLNRQTQSLQGINASQYFMNYGDYYPGIR
jgi:hypothetical protein